MEGVYLDAGKRIKVNQFPSRTEWLMRDTSIKDKENYIQIQTLPPYFNETTIRLNQLQESVERWHKRYQES